MEQLGYDLNIPWPFVFIYEISYVHIFKAWDNITHQTGINSVPQPRIMLDFNSWTIPNALPPTSSNHHLRIMDAMPYKTWVVS